MAASCHRLQRALYIPAVSLDALANASNISSEHVAPLSKRALFTESLDDKAGPAVGTLLFWRGPPTIPGFVVTIVIRPAIECLTFRALTHVGEEILKYLPAVTDFDTPTAVMVVSVIVDVATALHHALP